jgi:tetratricopeptide (TPR) repeat protein
VPLAYWSSLRDYTLPPKLLVLQVALAVLYAYWATKGPRSISLTSAGLPAIAYLAANIVSLSAASHPVASLLDITRILSGVLLFLALANLIKPSQLTGLLRVWMGTALFVSVVGIVQHLGFRPFNLPSAGFPSATLGFRNIAAMYLIQSIPFAVAFLATSQKRVDRILGGTTLAALTVFLIYTRTRGAWVGIFLATYAIAGLWTLRSLPPSRQPLYAGLFLLNPILAGLVLGFPYLLGEDLPYGYGFGAAAFTSILFWLWLTGSRIWSVSSQQLDLRRVGLILSAVGVVTAMSLLPTRLPKIGPQSVDEKKADLSTAVSSLLSREGGRGRNTMWRHTISMFSEAPILGVGAGNWSVHYPRFDKGDRVTFGAAPERPHNDLLWILSETGILGILCYLWLAISVLWKAWGLLTANATRVRWFSAACLTSLLAITGHSLFSFPKERVTPTVIFWSCIGLLYILDPNDRSRVWKPKKWSLMMGASMVLLATQLYLTSRIVMFETAMNRAVVSERSSDWNAVAEATGEALESGPFHAEAVHLRGYALNQTGRFEASRQMYTRALNRRPYDIQMLNGIAIACQNLGLNDEAIGYYRRALDTVPDLADVCFNLAGLYARIGRLNDAIQTFRRTIELRSNDAQSYYALGELFTRTDRVRDAVSAYKAFIHYWKGDPKYAQIARTRIAELASKKSR